MAEGGRVLLTLTLSSVYKAEQRRARAKTSAAARAFRSLHACHCAHVFENWTRGGRHI